MQQQIPKILTINVYSFMLTQHYKETKNHPEQLSNIKIFIDLCNQVSIKYPNGNNYALFDIKIWKLP